MVQLWTTSKAKCHGRYNNGIFLIPSMSLLYTTLGFFFLIECDSHGNILDILKENDIEVNELAQIKCSKYAHECSQYSLLRLWS